MSERGGVFRSATVDELAAAATAAKGGDRRARRPALTATTKWTARKCRFRRAWVSPEGHWWPRTSDRDRSV